MHQFLNEPPGWFAFLLWTYPFIVYPALMPFFWLGLIACSSHILVTPQNAGIGAACIFLLPLIALFFNSLWLRKNISMMVLTWVFALILMQFMTGMTQGALSSAISKAFSAVNSQLIAEQAQEKTQKSARDKKLSKESAVDTKSKQDRLERLQESYEKSLEQAKETVGENNPQTAQILYKLGSVLQEENKTVEALARYQQCLYITEQVPSSYRTGLALQLRQYQLLLLSRGRKDEASWIERRLDKLL